MPVTFPTSPLTVEVSLALGADLTADPATWSWTDITTYVRYEPGIVVTRGRNPESSSVNPAQCRLTLDNTSGRFTPRHPTGAYYPNIRRNTPLRVRVNPGTGLETRFTGFVDEWPLAWDASGNEKHVSVVASGLLRRLQQGAQPLKSPLRRAIGGDGDLVAYWPMEDASGSASFAAASTGTTAATAFSQTGAVTFAADDTLAGSEALPSITEISGVSFDVPAHPRGSAWSLSWVMKIPASPSSSCVLMYWHTPGSFVREWRLWLNQAGTDNVSLEGLGILGNDLIQSGGLNFLMADGSTPYGKWLLFRVSIVQNGADITWQYSWDDGNGVVSTSGPDLNITVTNITRIDHHPGDMGERQLGHMSVRSSSTAPSWASALDGYSGETTQARITRICAEEGIPYAELSASGGDLLGAQPLETAVSIIDEAAATDLGLYAERFDGRLGYGARVDQWNQAADLALDYDSRHLQPGFEPIDDDQAFRNDVTVTRRGGSSGHYEDEAHVAAEGRYDDPAQINPVDDTYLRHYASFRVARGTVDDFRYPSVGLNFARTPSLVTSWLACDLGSRVTIDNPPDELPPDQIDLLIDGYTETITPHNWFVDLNCSNGRPYQVIELDGSANLSRLESEGSELNAAATSGATSLKVHSLGTGPVWTGADQPFDLNVGGERVTCTAVATNAATFVGAGTAASNGNAAGTSTLAPALHASTAADDLVLVLASIRNSGTGTVNTPTGYTRLWPDPDDTSVNVALFAKIAASGESAPTVSFTGGVANATIIAQTATFRNLSINVHASVGALNSSAQNIAYPGLDLERDRCVVIYLGWKADDWTSVTSPGTEIGEPDDTAGDDAGLVWAYTIQTTRADIVAGSFTVTGGASAISRGAVVAIAGDVQTFTVTRSVNGVTKAQTAGTDVSLWRANVLAL